MSNIINAPDSVKMIINLFGVHAFIALLAAVFFGLLFFIAEPFLIFFYIIYLVLSFYLRDIIKKQSSDIPNRIVRVVFWLIIDTILGSTLVVNLGMNLAKVRDLMAIYGVALIFGVCVYITIYIIFAFLLVSYLRQSPQVKEYYGANADRWI